MRCNISRFITILRTNYGQYWIKELEPWDSRKYPLGHYCHTFLQMQWSLDNEQTWKYFKPSDGPITIHVTLPSDDDFQQYLSPKDYKDLERLINDHYSPTLAATSIGLAHQTLDQGNFKYALVEAVTSLELALQEFHRTKSKSNKELAKHMDAFWNLPLKAQLLATASCLPEYDVETLKEAIKVIDMRNDVVHEGKNPPYNGETIKSMRAFLKLVSLFVDGPRFKFPPDAQGANTIYPVA